MIEFFTVMFGVVLAQISPGPNFVAVASMSLSNGRVAGLFTVLGVSIAILFWALLFAFGVGALLISFPETINFIRILGGSYLLYMGIKAFKSALKKRDFSKLETLNTVSHFAAFRKGLFVNLTNPKSAMMWVAISMYLSSSAGPSSFKVVLLGIAASLTAFVIYSTYAYIFSSKKITLGYQRFYRVIEALFGCLFGFLGAKVLLQGIDNLELS